MKSNLCKRKENKSISHFTLIAGPGKVSDELATGHESEPETAAALANHPEKYTVQPLTSQKVIINP